MKATNSVAQDNIDTIVRLEEQALQTRSKAERIADSIANFVGSFRFLVLQLLWFGVWIGLNTGLLKFDPYPFSMLCLMVSLESVLLSTFVLMKQSRMSERADHRAHLDLQINLLTEKEVTKILQMQRLICRRLGISEADTDAEVVELSDTTAVEHLAQELKKQIPIE